MIDWKDGREFGVHDKDTKSKSKDKRAKSFFDWLSKDVSHTNKIAQALDDVYGSPMEFSKVCLNECVCLVGYPYVFVSPTSMFVCMFVYYVHQ